MAGYHFEWRFADKDGSTRDLSFGVRDQQTADYVRAVLESMRAQGLQPIGPVPEHAPFDLARARAGDPIETESGLPMVFMFYNPEGQDGQQVVARPDKPGSRLRCYCENGRAKSPEAPAGGALRMRAASVTLIQKEKLTDYWLDQQNVAGRKIMVFNAENNALRGVRILSDHPTLTAERGVFQLDNGGRYWYDRATGNAGEFGILRVDATL